MSVFEKIKYYYDHGLWSFQRVANVVGKPGGITAEDFKSITGEDYQATE